MMKPTGTACVRLPSANRPKKKRATKPIIVECVWCSPVGVECRHRSPRRAASWFGIELLGHKKDCKRWAAEAVEAAEAAAEAAAVAAEREARVEEEKGADPDCRDVAQLLYL